MSVKVEITVAVKRLLRIPDVPAFVRDDRGLAILIEDLSPDQLREIAQRWTDTLMDQARIRAEKKRAILEAVRARTGG
jgi:hypothetical protein